MFFDTRNRLLTLKGRYYERSFSASEFTKVIRRQFPAADLCFRTQRDYAVDPNMVIVAGLYDCYNDAHHLPHTEITLCYHPEQELYFGNLLNWEQLTFDIAECIGHELVHRQQYQKGKKSKQYKSNIDNQIYLGESAEIEAYGFSIAAEAVAFDRNYHDCAMYQIYTKTFDIDHSVVVKLEKQIVKYLKELELEYEQSHPI